MSSYGEVRLKRIAAMLVERHARLGYVNPTPLDSNTGEGAWSASEYRWFLHVTPTSSWFYVIISPDLNRIFGSFILNTANREQKVRYSYPDSMSDLEIVAAICESIRTAEQNGAAA